jgi:hypothetical protein
MGLSRSLVAQIQEVERELALRERVYARETNNRKRNENEEHMARMVAVLHTLQRLQRGDTGDVALGPG